MSGWASAGGRPARFLGIPYAAPPTGDRRFLPPEPPAPWTAVRDATAFGAASAQVYDPHEAAMEEFGVARGEGTPAPAWVGDEDCLTLNVWTPAADAAGRPVLVWIHGGANWLESSRLGCYDGGVLCASGDVVVVSLNYRLGLFGFLDLGDADPRWQANHCNGLRDQWLALQWVHDNIARFGGDPRRVTLAGESAGAMNISWLAATGRLQALVQRVVLMSGVASLVGFGHDHEHCAHAPAEGRARARRFLRELGVDPADGPARLQAMTTDDWLSRHAALAARAHTLFDLDTLFYPRLDPAFAARTPFEAAAQGGFDGLELMIGFTAYEMGLWLQWDPTLDRHDTAWMSERLPHFPAAERAAAAAFYDRVFAAEPPGVRAMHLLGDAMFAMPSVLLARTFAARNGRVWMYRFDWSPDARRGALHAADQAFFFGTLDSDGARRLVGTPADAADAAGRERLARAMQRRLLAFVRDGDPQAAGEPHWPRFDATQRVLHFDAPKCRVEARSFEPRWSWWNERVFAPARSLACS